MTDEESRLRAIEDWILSSKTLEDRLRIIELWKEATTATAAVAAAHWQQVMDRFDGLDRRLDKADAGLGKILIGVIITVIGGVISFYVQSRILAQP